MIELIANVSLILVESDNYNSSPTDATMVLTLNYGLSPLISSNVAAISEMSQNNQHLIISFDSICNLTGII